MRNLDLSEYISTPEEIIYEFAGTCGWGQSGCDYNTEAAVYPTAISDNFIKRIYYNTDIKHERKKLDLELSAELFKME